MIALQQPDRWSCPTCKQTEMAIPGNDDAVHNYIVRVQQLHAHQHAAERTALLKAGAR